MRIDLKSDIKNKLLLASIPCIVLLITAIAGGIEFSPFPDAVEYQKLANSLADNFSFEHADVSLCRRVPGYPFCLMLFFWMGAYAYLFLNFLFLFGTCFFLLSIAQINKIQRSWVLIVFCALSPGLIAISACSLSETAFLFFTTLCIFLFFKDKYLCSGLALSAATFCRPISIFLFLLFALYMAWKKRKVIVILIFIIAANLLPGFWMVRNYIKYNHAAYTTLTGINLLFYKAGSYLSWKNDISFNDTRADLSKQIQGDDVFERNSSAGKLGRKILLENFCGFCMWAPRNMIHFWMPDITPLFERLGMISGNRGTLDVLRRKGLLSAISHYFNNNIAAMSFTAIYLIYYAITLALMGAGAIRLWLEKKYSILIFGAMFVGYFWILPLGNLDWRFRMPVLPVLFLLALYGFNGIWLWYKSRKKLNLTNS